MNSSLLDGQVRFGHDDRRLWLTRLFGLPAGQAADDGGPRGPGVLRTLDGYFDGNAFRLVDRATDADALVATWTAGASGVQLRTRWEPDPAAGAVLRTDTLTNASDRPVTILRYLARQTFQPGPYSAYVQSGRWDTENQGRWVPLHAGRLVLAGTNGRTTQGAAPYAALRNDDAGVGICLHVVPCGNWMLGFTSHPIGQGLAALVVEWGQSDEHLKLTLAPGEAWESPPVLITPLDGGEPHLAAHRAHRFANARWLAGHKPEPPIVYNTWLDVFDNLIVDRLRGQLAAAREVGCEVFVIDAGWFGAGRGDWFNTTGHWHENPAAAFHGRMRDFADEVRAAGLGFGLWIEPEHVGPDAPVRREHPEWFVGGTGMGGGGGVSGWPGPRLDLEQPAARDWIRAEMERLITAYDLAWMKVDFNIELGRDDRGGELSRYYAVWFDLMDDLRRRYPQVFFEGCASGGMRLDLRTLRYCDCHFMTDNTNAADQLRIGEGALLRLPPGRLSRWVTPRSVGRTIPNYPETLAEAPEWFVTAPAAGWQPVQHGETVDLDFAALCAVVGTYGLSGDLLSLSPDARARLAKHSAFYKQWRRFLSEAHAHPLTCPAAITDRTGWSAVQLSHQTRPEHLVFVYRLQDNRALRLLPLRELTPGATYRLTGLYDASIPTATASTEELTTTGLEVRLPRPGTAGVVVLEPRG